MLTFELIKSKQTDNKRNVAGPFTGLFNSEKKCLKNEKNNGQKTTGNQIDYCFRKLETNKRIRR